jgi:hypothetical protein
MLAANTQLDDQFTAVLDGALQEFAWAFKAPPRLAAA